MNSEQPIKADNQMNFGQIKKSATNTFMILSVVAVVGGIIYFSSNLKPATVKAELICSRSNTAGCSLDGIKVNRDILKKQKAEQAAIKSELESQINKVNTNNTNIDQEDKFWSEKFSDILNK